MRTPRLYADLAAWWPLMSPPEDYAEEAAFYLNALHGDDGAPPQSLLELGSGGGNNASHMKAHVREMVLVDLSEGMLDVSRRINPDCEHVQGDMRSVRLGRTFDAVFVHDAVSYMTTEEDLRRAIATAAAHCRPGGTALFVPDHLRETFTPATDCGGTDGPDGAGLRYLEWSWDPDPSDSSCVTHYTYVLRSADGSVRVEHELTEEGLFPRPTWQRLLREAGFDARAVPVEHSELESGTYEMFVGRRG
jgi:SAM-dependent methyltransferase